MPEHMNLHTVSWEPASTPASCDELHIRLLKTCVNCLAFRTDNLAVQVSELSIR